MLLNASLDCENVYSMYCDDYHTMYDATLSMYRSGITDIIYLYCSKSYSRLNKLEGFEAALASCGVADITKHSFYYDGDIEDFSNIASFVASIADSGVSFHGVLAANDSLAIGTIKYALSHELQVPQDLSVIGYNNSILTKCSTPELISIDNRLEPMTHQLIETLIQVLSGKEMPKKSIFSGQLVHRGTTLF